MADQPDVVKALLAEISSEFPEFKLVTKGDSRLMRTIDVFLRVITLNLMKAFLTGYITTIGYTVYASQPFLDDPNPYSKLVVLRHERVHMRQRRKYGMALFSVLYVLLPLPGLLAYFRMRFEREAYEETIRAAAELSADPAAVTSAEWRTNMVSVFTGPAYFFMWPFRKSVEAWFDSYVTKVVKAETDKRAMK
jgi:hypothetical protein